MRIVCFHSAILAALLLGCSPASTVDQPAVQERIDSDGVLAQAFADEAHGLPVEGSGVVTRLLSDDNQEPRHQRFVIELDSGQELLIAHNIDLAPRVQKIRKGDRVKFSGEYEWNKQGGVIHWTHRDPAQRHTAGWIRHNDQTYQ